MKICWTNRTVKKAHLVRCASIDSLQRTTRVRLRSSIIARLASGTFLTVLKKMFWQPLKEKSMKGYNNSFLLTLWLLLASACPGRCSREFGFINRRG